MNCDVQDFPTVPFHCYNVVPVAATAEIVVHFPSICAMIPMKHIDFKFGYSFDECFIQFTLIILQ